MLVYGVLSIVVSIVVVITARMTGEMSEAALRADTTALLQLLGLISALTALRAVCAAVNALLEGRFAAKVGYKFRDNFARYFLRLPFSKLEKEQSGASLSIYTNDLPGGALFASRFGLLVVADIISLVVTFVYMLMLTPGLTLLFFAMFPVLVVMQVLISSPIQKKQIKMSEEQANFNAIVNDSLQNTSTIAAYSLEEVLKARYMDAYDRFFEAIRSFIKSMSTMVIAGIMVSLAPLLIIFMLAASRVIRGDMYLFEYIAFTNLAFQCSSWLMMLSQRLTEVQVAAAGAKRLNEHTLEDLDLSVSQELPPFRPTENENTAVQLSNLSFAYNEESGDAVSEIDLTIKKGSKVAFVGGSGSGKSTLLKLMLGLYAPTAGEVSVFGRKEIPINAFAYVPQDSFLFPESIGGNITSSQTPDTTRLETACRDAGIWDFINTLPDKFDGVLAESADNVSGGQKQRIALARAFYQDAPIVLFDEATSALDPTTESEVLKSFETMLSHEPDKTVIMVAHRPKAIAFCDTIVMMENGKIIGIGSHEHLLATCPEYTRLEVA
ncbi:MAG: ABC transporter ATP-binding protein/permease [Defluviitaleaceae bacterium]|nr:ABC transporter ATP-binding protein/permease [Defluviitaleaceae bacterium]